MKKIENLLLLLMFFMSPSFTQNTIDWQMCYGGSEGEGAYSLVATDNGYAMFCGTSSQDGDISYFHGEADYWLVAIDSLGYLLWEKTYGGTENESPRKIIKTYDGGYILFGYTHSVNGDVTGSHGGFDWWIVKTDNMGNLLWQKCYGGSGTDYAVDIKQTSDGGFICIGETASTDGDISGHHGNWDMWVVKLEYDGEIEWQKCYGGYWGDSGIGINQTEDGGYIIGGKTKSPDGDVLCELHSEYDSDAWVIKTDGQGNIEWQHCYGGTYWDAAGEVMSTDDGGYIIEGFTASNDGDVSGFHGSPGTPGAGDIWVVKINELGSIEWQKCLGGSDYESPKFIKIGYDGNYLIGGTTDSHNGDVTGNHSNSPANDIWLVKLSTSGEIIWEQCFGSTNWEVARDILLLSENEYLLAGQTKSSYTSGDVDCEHFAPGVPADNDVWLFKVTDTTVGIDDSFENNGFVKVYPNPMQDYIVFEISDAIKNQSGEIIIINVFGQKVETLAIKNEKTVWDTRKTIRGIYFYTVIVEGERYISGKIVKQ
jgi:hypothetical protein